MAEFHNPYHFVPVNKRDNKDNDLSVEKFTKRILHHHSHASYQKTSIDGTSIFSSVDLQGKTPIDHQNKAPIDIDKAKSALAMKFNSNANPTSSSVSSDHKKTVKEMDQPDKQPLVYHGRLICKLTTEDPIFIGDKCTKDATEDSPAEIAPFEINGKPAIPASTLRGMISSIAEAASNSALRVLTDSVLSFRKKAKPEYILSALGMVLYDDKKDKYSLLPLSMPTLTRQGNNYKLECVYKNIFTRPFLKVYVGSYEGQIIDEAMRDKVTFRCNEQKFFYLQLKKDRKIKKGIISCDEFLRHPKDKEQFVIGQKPLGDSYKLLSEEEYNKIPKPNDYVRGILRILGKEGRTDIPKTKEHELFIPFPEDINDHNNPIPIPKCVVDRFHQLADIRAEATKKAKKDNERHPYNLLGTSRTIVEKKKISTLRLKHGDIVYFRPDDKRQVAELSFSSIWRGRVEKSAEEPETVFSFFKKIDPEVLPMNKNRESISPAELIFGFVQAEKKDEKEDNNTTNLAYASKVRFSAGLLDPLSNNSDKLFDDNYTALKILSSPKPPSPALYFKNKNRSATYIEKSKLSTENHLPQGRKFYLHRQNDIDESKSCKPWITEREESDCRQKVKVKLLKKGLSFYFHIDFDNMTELELGLLCYAIQPPDSFRHKIGMGKPLGLGKIKVEPIGLFLIDRIRRYEKDPLFSPSRYHKSWGDKKILGKLPDCYQKEKKMELFGEINDVFNYLITSFRNKTVLDQGKDSVSAIEVLGNPNVTAPVHYPQLEGAHIEGENFKWFVENEKHQQKMLIPINENKDKLPTLERYQEEDTETKIINE